MTTSLMDVCEGLAVASDMFSLSRVKAAARCGLSSFNPALDERYLRAHPSS
jgi:hypothetical protein